MDLEFSALHLIIGGESPSAAALKPAFSKANDIYSVSDTHYKITKENLEDKYFWLHANYGTSKPYSKTVYNTESSQEENNPKTPNQIEPHKQLFALYAVRSRILYLSKPSKDTLMQDYLKAQLEQDVVIKAFFKNVDEFIKKIKSISKVKFVTKSNLFSTQGDIMKIFPSPNDLYGLGMPTDFTLEATFQNAKPTALFVEKLKKMVGWKNNCEADFLCCVGQDDKNFETVFNIDSFIQKVKVKAVKNENGLYNETTVKQALIAKVGGMYEENS